MAQRMPDVADFWPAFCDIMPDRTLTTARHFSPLAQSGSQLGKVPRRSLLVSTTTNQNERPLLALAPKGPAADVARMTQ
jgi:hypothetical protein